jgi:Methionine synthase I, cobalamin-binding domain
VKVPLMIDSTDEKVIEKALTYCQGKSIINSINLEDGEERFKKVVPLIHRYGAAVIVGTIDERGMAVKAEEKLAIAKRSYDLLVNKYG